LSNLGLADRLVSNGDGSLTLTPSDASRCA
jgi:hypothetical protein